MKNKELIEQIISHLDMGNPSIAVELLFRKRRSKTFELSVLIIDLTQELIAKGHYRSLQSMKDRLNWYKDNNVTWG
ncbi:hypothetical protein XaC1_31 [Xanthomonas phage XaC1]|nr:hypothetical protein XaC1_31 [Xanthomonas phage XaC1]